MRKAELKRCPFCGGEADLVKRTLVVAEKVFEPVYEVRCSRCLVSTGGHFSPGHVVRVWNKRSPAPVDRTRQSGVTRIAAELGVTKGHVSRCLRGERFSGRVMRAAERRAV